jgi:hypothetical protein
LLRVVLFLLWLAPGCRTAAPEEEKAPPAGPAVPTLFTLLPPERTGIAFANTLTEGPNTNVLMYEYFYNGGGVAAGDLNGDGLDDLYFTANMAPNRLYLNKGNLQFADISEASGAAGREGPWKTGVTFADVNGDGRLDVYLCYSGNLRPERLVNALYLNTGNDAQGVPHFADRTREYGLDFPSYCTQGQFFDYDRDGDLDLFLLNHRPEQLPPLDDVSLARMYAEENPLTGPRLLRHDRGPGGAGRFTDVTKKAGLHASSMSYGLGAALSDLDGDGWPDLYVSNDYIVPDYLYRNNRDGTFSEVIKKRMGHTSHFSMGNDAADVNNDGLTDLLTLDMLPEDNRRQKLLFAPDNYEKFDLNLRAGFGYQYMRNMLHLNNGNGTYSEVGQLAGISNTDWSWASLFADYDNDGWKDLFVTNGYVRDFTNLDFMKYMADFTGRTGGSLGESQILSLVQQVPASGVVNYAFRNNGDLTFSNVGASWGMTLPSNSNGAAYTDLDNDGDLDLVVNNINQPAFVYQNRAIEEGKGHFLRVRLAGEGMNTHGLGARVTVSAGGRGQLLEQMPARGYQSSVSPVLHFGLGKATVVDTLTVAWPGGARQLLRNVPADTLLTLREGDARRARPVAYSKGPAGPVFRPAPSPLPFAHAQPAVNDFKRQPLLVNPLSFAGPCLVKGDVNGDGRDDLYAGGGPGQAGVLYLGGPGGKFTARPTPAFAADGESDDVNGLFFDANADSFPDLYVCSGGYHAYAPDDPRLQDRLYLNDGKGNFTKSPDALPAMPVSSGCVRAEDVNGDGHPDLFVGGRVVPGRYPETPRSCLLLNDGKGRFRDATATLAPGLAQAGLVTDAAWADLDGDGPRELVVVGEWMPVRVWKKQDGKLAEATDAYFAKPYRGWWNKLLAGDFNGDGKADLLVGNLGLNSQCRATDAAPAELYYKDFDDNGSVDPILCLYTGGRSYPYVSRDELLDQISLMRTRFPDYKSYADATLQDIFTPEELRGATRLSANCLATTFFASTPGGKLREGKLPPEAQFAPVFAVTALDYNRDGQQDLVLAGNVNRARLRLGNADANYGLLLRGDGRGNFAAVPQRQSGLQLRGDVRCILNLDGTLLFGLNGQPVAAYQSNRP